MAQVYCGSNRLYPQRTGHRLGSRYECFRKGIGVGLHLPDDPEYKYPYQPVDERKLYCGNAGILPFGYDLMGSPAMCLRRGVGVGKKLKMSRKGKKKGRKSRGRKSRGRKSRGRKSRGRKSKGNKKRSKRSKKKRRKPSRKKPKRKSR